MWKPINRITSFGCDCNQDQPAEVNAEPIVVSTIAHQGDGTFRYALTLTIGGDHTIITWDRRSRHEAIDLVARWAMRWDLRAATWVSMVRKTEDLAAEYLAGLGK